MRKAAAMAQRREAAKKRKREAEEAEEAYARDKARGKRVKRERDRVSMELKDQGAVRRWVEQNLVIGGAGSFVWHADVMTAYKHDKAYLGPRQLKKHLEAVLGPQLCGSKSTVHRGCKRLHG